MNGHEVKAIRPLPSAAGVPRRVAVTVPAATTDALAFLGAAPADAPKVLVEDVARRVTLAGFGVAAVVTADGPGRFRAVEAGVRDAFTELRHEPAPGSPAGPRFLGGFAFSDDHTATGVWRDFPGAWFVLPESLLTVTPRGAWLTVTRDRPDGGGVTPRVVAAPARDAPFASFARGDEDKRRAAWAGDVDAVLRRIRAGDAEKVVLARAVDGRVTGDVPATAALGRLGDQAPGCARFLVAPAPGSAFFGATPETLLTARGRDARTAALAATAPRGATPREDAALAARLAASGKERREHALVVDAIRDALSRFASDVTVEPAAAPVRYASVQHLRTGVTARFRAPGRLLRAAEALHPTPAVAGTPRSRALDVIRGTEPTPRGWYAGAVGWLDANLDGALLVAIRSAVRHGDRVRAFAGAGVLEGSDVDAEYAETVAKLTPMLDALEGRS